MGDGPRDGWEAGGGRREARALPSQLSLSPSADVSPETIGLMLATKLVKKSLRKSRASCRGRCRSERPRGSGAHRALCPRLAYSPGPR